MATFVRIDANVDDTLFHLDPVRWPAGYFYDDPRMRRTDDFWQDWVGAFSNAEMREFRETHGLRSRDTQLDELLDGNWDGWMLVRCGEWES